MEISRTRSRVRASRDVRSPRRSTYGHENAANVMQVSCNPSYGADDWYGRGAMGVLGLGFNGSAPKQPVREEFRAAEAPLVSREGIRHSMGNVVLGLLALFLAIMLMTQLADMLDTGNRVAAARNQITQAEETNKTLNKNLELAENTINVGYEAAQRGMISAKNMEAIKLNLPQNIGTVNTADAGNGLSAADYLAFAGK